MTYELYHGDCLDILPTLAAGSVDAVICDPPYGTTACKWDSVIPFEPMWREIKRVLKPRGACVLFGSQPFTSALVMSNPKWFRYDWTWYKNAVTGIALAKHQPMRCKEDILVFGSGPVLFNKQPTRSRIQDRKLGGKNGIRTTPSNHYDFAQTGQQIMLKEWVNPRNVIEIPIDPMSKGRIHPTQKPLALMEYLIRTYTNEGDAVLDFTFGSCTTGVGCLTTGRNFIGIERDAEYFKIGSERMQAKQEELRGTLFSYDMTDTSTPSSQEHSPLVQSQMSETA